MREAERRAGEEPIPHTDPLNALQWIVNRLYQRLIHASQEVDQLRPGQLTVMTAFGPTDHEWVRAEQALTKQLSEVCINVARVGLAERLVQIEEAKAHLMFRALTESLLDAGVSRDQLRAAGPSFRAKLAALQQQEAA